MVDDDDKHACCRHVVDLMDLCRRYRELVHQLEVRIDELQAGIVAERPSPPCAPRLMTEDELSVLVRDLNGDPG